MLAFSALPGAELAEEAHQLVEAAHASEQAIVGVAIANIREAIVACFEVRAEQGLPLTVRTVEVGVAVA